MTSFSFKDYQLHYTIKGEGQALLFLHGFLENSSMWKDILSSFSLTEYQLITVDLPCHGQSRYQGGNCSMKEMAQGVDALLNSLGIKKLFCIGHSMGGYVALELAVLRELKVILLHSNFWADAEHKKEDRNRVIDIVLQNKNRFINEAIPNLFADQNRDKYTKEIEQIVSQAITVPASEISAATAGMRDRKSFINKMGILDLSIIHGELDPIISSDQLATALAVLEKQPPVIRMKNCGHMSIWESKTELIKAIKSLLIQ